MAIEVVLPAELVGQVRAQKGVSHTWKALPERPVVGLIDNVKTGAAEFLDALGRALVRRGAAASYFVWQKPNTSHAITQEEHASMLARAHVIVSGVGD